MGAGKGELQMNKLTLKINGPDQTQSVTINCASYKQWVEAVYAALDQWPTNVLAGWEKRFSIIDFRGMYRAGFSSQHAAELAKDVTSFLKPAVERK